MGSAGRAATGVLAINYRPLNYQLSECCASCCPLVAALLRVRPQFRLVFTELLRMLRVQRRDRYAVCQIVLVLACLAEASERRRVLLLVLDPPPSAPLAPFRVQRSMFDVQCCVREVPIPNRGSMFPPSTRRPPDAN